MKYVVFSLVMMFILFSCGGKKVESDSLQKEEVIAEDKIDKVELFTIDVEQALKKIEHKRVPFSLFGDSIEYIPLETTLKSLLGGGRFGIQTQLVTDKIILIDMKCFDRQTGHYLGDLLKKGQGAQEYLWITSVAADDEREEFYLYDETKSKIYVVGYDNTFKKSISCGSSDIKIFNLGKGNILVARTGYSLSATYDDFFVINVDTKETILKKRSSVFSNIQSLDDCESIYMGREGYWTVNRNNFWRYKDKVCYYDSLTDSVFTVDKGLHVSPVGTLLMGNLKLSKEQAKIRPRKRDFVTWFISNVVEADKYILVYVFNLVFKPIENREAYLLVYSKEDKHTIAYQYPDEGYVFENDIDNTVPFSLNQICNSSFLYGLISIEEVKERASMPFDEKGKTFKKMADKLQYDDNEVIGILK